jgi:hypothetical protein
MATPEGRHFLAHNGFQSGQAVIVAQYDETIQDVMARVHAHRPPVTVALAKDVDADDLQMFEVRPADRQALDDAALASPQATIGMLYEAAQQGGGNTFRVTEWDQAATAVSFPEARQLLSV